MTTAGTPAFAHIIMNTRIAGAAGGSVDVAYAVFRVLHEFRRRPDGGGLRVSDEDKRIGLNVSERDAPVGTEIPQAATHALAPNPEAKLRRIEIDHGDEPFELAMPLKRIVDHNAARRARETANASRYVPTATRSAGMGVPIPSCSLDDDGWSEVAVTERRHHRFGIAPTVDLGRHLHGGTSRPPAPRAPSGWASGP